MLTTIGKKMTTLHRQKLRCPKCSTSFYKDMIASFGSSGAYSDLCPIYTGAAPILFLPVSCPKCPFTAYPEEYEFIEKTATFHFEQENQLEELPSPQGPKKYMKAIESYRKLNADEEKIADLYVTALWCFHYGDFNDVNKEQLAEEAIGYLHATVQKDQINPQNREAYMYLLGEFSRRAGKFDEATQYFDNFIKESKKKKTKTEKRAETDENRLLDLALRMKTLSLRRDSSDQIA